MNDIFPTLVVRYIIEGIIEILRIKEIIIFSHLNYIPWQPVAHVAGESGCFLQRGIVEGVGHLTMTMGVVLGQQVCSATKSIVQGVVLLKTQPLDNYWKTRVFLLSQCIQRQPCMTPA